MKKKKLIIIFIIFAMIISFPFTWYYAVGPRVCSDGVSNERCLYYKFNIYHSMYSVDYYSDLEKQGIVLKKKIGNYMTEWYYLATDEYGDEIIVADYIDYSVVYKK